MMNLGQTIKNCIKMFCQHILLPLAYEAGKRGGVKENLVIFADAHHNSLPENMRLVHERLKESGEFDIRDMFLDYQGSSLASVLKNMLGFMFLYARAGTVVLCDNYLPAASCKKRPGTKVIQLWHACGAYKKFGFDAPDDIPAGYVGNVYRNTDVVTVSAERCRAFFSGAMGLPVRSVKALGISRTDRYFSESWRKACRERFYREYPDAEGKKIVLWAPTFRGNAGNPTLPEFSAEELEEELGEGVKVFVKVHPHMEKHYRGECVRLSTEEMYPVTDVLISDYSSLIFEYLLFDRPLVLYVPDLEEYRKKRGFYLDFDSIPAGIVTEKTDLPKAVRAEISEKKRAEERKAFTGEWMSACDGKATERIISLIKNGN